VRHDQRGGQDEYDENRDPPALAIATVEPANVGGKIFDECIQCARGIPVNVSNVAQLPDFSKRVLHACPARFGRTTSTHGAVHMSGASVMACGPFRP
jgi:hypothetical protein